MLRSFEEKLDFLSRRGVHNDSAQNSPQDKMIGICLDSSVAAAALCREAGIPARARCGFATYFEPGKYIDHWGSEYLTVVEQRSVMVDPQLDELQLRTLRISFDPLDVGEEHFLTGP